MSAADPYLQFPLCLLAHEKDVHDRLTTILAYCVVEFFDRTAKGSQSERWKQAHEKLGFSGGSYEHFKQRHGEAASFICSMIDRFGQWPNVRIRTTFLFEARDNEGMTYREFSALCAIYSAIGAAPYPVVITRDMIRARMLGYKSASTLFDKAGQLTTQGKRLLKYRSDAARPLTTDQIRYTLDTLEQKGLFARCQPSKRKVYFSNRLNREDMRKKLFGWKTRRAFTLRNQRDADRELQAKIREVNETNTRPVQPDNSPPIPHLNRESEPANVVKIDPPRNPQSVPTESPPSPHSVPTKIETSLIETVQIETSPIETRGARAFSGKSFPPPPETVDEVIAFGSTVRKTASEQECRAWWDDNCGKDWTAADWKKDAARFLLDSRRRRTA